jgi:Glycosyl transferase 4-like domain
MRILYCNKYNFPFSGTEVYLFELIDLMRSGGHEVALFSMSDPRGPSTAYDRHFVPHVDFRQRKQGLISNALLAAHAIYSREARRRLAGMIAEFRPDVAHVRNIYHHLSPSILWELKKHGVPVIYHLNDFKLLCPSYKWWRMVALAKNAMEGNSGTWVQKAASREDAAPHSSWRQRHTFTNGSEHTSAA